MCTEVFIRYECDHKELQNTCLCSKATRDGTGDHKLLEKTVFLPTKPPNIPPGLFGCKVRKATRPVSGPCPACRRHTRITQSDSNSSNSTMRSSSSGSSANSTGKRNIIVLGSVTE
ncbi:hypothetical protein F5Y08DRAFT_301473 [Xylaria arbuscula]|nr:hypothetical protein F5Y08DRAFT_301473 [Xylaria arbuscula]